MRNSTRLTSPPGSLAAAASCTVAPAGNDWPLVGLDKLTIGAGKRGPITEQIQRRFLDVVHGRVADRHNWLTYVRDVVAEHAPDATVAAASRA